MAKLDQQRASSPETSLAELLTLAEQYPDEVLANPVLPMLSLSEPERFIPIYITAEAENMRRNIQKQYTELTEEKRRRFLLVCTERVVPVFDDVLPGSAMPELLQSVRLILAGVEPLETLATLHAQAKELTKQARREREQRVDQLAPTTEIHRYQASECAAQALEDLTSPNPPAEGSNEIAIWAERWYELSSTTATDPSSKERELIRQLRKWQLDRLQEIK